MHLLLDAYVCIAWQVDQRTACESQSSLPFLQVGAREQTQVIRFDSKDPYLPNHLTSL